MRPARVGASASTHGGDERLRRSDRLRKAKEFRRVSRSGRRGASRRHPAFVLVAAETGGGSEGSRLGLAVGRRVGSAVVRNRVKRRVREWFRRGGRERLPGAVDLVVIARAPAAELDRAGVARELDALCQELGGGRG